MTSSLSSVKPTGSVNWMAVANRQLALVTLMILLWTPDAAIFRR